MTTIMTKTTPQTTREAVVALLHELNLKGMTRVLPVRTWARVDF